MLKERAITTLEMLLSLILALPVVAAMGAALHSSVLTYFRIKLETDSRIALFRSAGLIRQTLEDLDSSRFDISPRIHRDGRIAFADGSPNPVVGISAGRAPSPDSDAITGLQLDLRRSQLVLTAKAASGTWHFLACSRFKEAFHQAAYKSYAGFSTDGAIELTGTVRTHSGRPDCRDFHLKPEKSMSLAAPHTVETGTVRVIVPMRRHYTLYIDQEHRLRFLAHQGEKNIENQPVQNGLLKMGFQILPDDGRRLCFLKTSIQAASGAEKDFVFHNNLSRLSELNFLLNRP